MQIFLAVFVCLVAGISILTMGVFLYQIVRAFDEISEILKHLTKP